MRISDSNKLVGNIMRIKPGQEMTEIIVDVGDQPVTATITAGAAHDMHLKEGDEVFAMFNSTSVTLIKDTKEPRRDYGF
ncbi:MAG: ABC transporter substrate-binding protein [Firmicutes bacterium HGW-Firmicutes-15]|nr:MAG: ABC transporter substrate-binding protein [Firmicutes bacterium HGW-Firmicutes-15]